MIKSSHRLYRHSHMSTIQLAARLALIAASHERRAFSIIESGVTYTARSAR